MFTNILTLIWLLLIIVCCVGFLLLTTNLKYLGSRLIRTYFLFGKLNKVKEEAPDCTPALSENLRKSGLNFKRELNNSNRRETNTSNLGCSLATQVPKSWFSHFYILGAAAHIIMLMCLISVLAGNPLPYSVKNIIHWFLLGSDQRGTMSIFHYGLGVFFYTSFGIGLMCSVNMEDLVFSDPSYAEILCYFLGVLMFSWGAYYQYKSMLTFALLRKEQKDHRQDGYYIPYGHLFEWVSCPHYLCEILIYLSFCLIFQFSIIHILVIAIFVLTNQTICSILVHKWYQQHFPNYPKFRAAVFPYIL